MQPLTLILLGILSISLLTCVLLSREFLQISAKREELLQVFDSEMRGTKRSKTTLLVAYILLTVILTGGLSLLLLLSV